MNGGSPPSLPEPELDEDDEAELEPCEPNDDPEDEDDPEEEDDPDELEDPEEPIGPGEPEDVDEPAPDIEDAELDAAATPLDVALEPDVGIEPVLAPPPSLPGPNGALVEPEPQATTTTAMGKVIGGQARMRNLASSAGRDSRPRTVPLDAPK